MYICICKAVTDSAIHEAVAEGCQSMRDLRKTLGCCTDCGRCARHTKEVLGEALAASAPCSTASMMEKSVPDKVDTVRRQRVQHDVRHDGHPVS